MILRFLEQKGAPDFQLFFSTLAHVSCHISKHLPMQTDWRPVEGLPDDFMMKTTEELLRKSHLERKSRMCKPGGLQKGSTSPALDDACVYRQVKEGERPGE